MTTTQIGPSGRASTAIVASSVFALAFLVRTANYPLAFVNGVPQFSPFDDLYHAKRMADSAARPFRVLSFDPDRGTSGAFCPWPPLYDMTAGLAARATGGETAVAALARVAWFPPLLAALAAALVAAGMSHRLGWLPGLVGGAGVALSVYYLDKSRLGAIDHHYLEFPLVLGILLAAVSLERARDSRSAFTFGGFLAVAVSLAVFVQPALVVAAGLALAAVLLLRSDDRMPRLAAAAGFALASLLVFVYRSVQPAGYPDNEWYLGTPHAALLLGAAAACAADAGLLARGASRVSASIAAVSLGGLVIAAVPGALPSLTGGSRFFGGNPWLRSISEFQPLFFHETSNWLFDLANLGAGSLVALAVLFDRTWWTGWRRIVLLFTIAYLALAVSSMRFLAVAAPLVAVAGALFYADLRNAGRRRLALAAAVVLLAPGLALSAARVARPAPAITPESLPMVQAAQTIAKATAWPGAVLAPWSWGHLFNVVADRRVLVDNFGSASSPTEFANATAITLVTREKMIADWCALHGVRFLVLEDPLPFFAARAEMSDCPRSAYEQPIGSGEPTHLMKSTFWWRAYFEGGRARPDLGPAGAPFRAFRLLHVETEPVASGRRTAVQIWEALPRP